MTRRATGRSVGRPVVLISVVDGPVPLRRLRALHVLGNLTAAGRAVIRADPAIPGTVNGAFVAESDLECTLAVVADVDR
ncbi:hypothetical protein [Lentzea sp. NPDC051838]|uniref:hypothetical protein n=1 Tax=Lentzea sp. NPDC051838 TaxID=3154849 RepID=UPI00344640AF